MSNNGGLVFMLIILIWWLIKNTILMFSMYLRIHVVLYWPYTTSCSLKFPSFVINNTPTIYLVSGSKSLIISVVMLLVSLIDLISKLLNVFSINDYKTKKLVWCMFIITVIFIY